mgnify:CR=1 FL=1
MPQLTLSRRTILAPTPGLTGKEGDKRKAIFGQPGDVLTGLSAVPGRGGLWFEATLERDGKPAGSGYVIAAALAGQPDAAEILAGDMSDG